MRFSLQVCYGICGLFDLAYNGQGGPVQVRVIGDRQQIPPRYLEQIFQRLRRAELVRSKRGPGGGYTLARAPGEINLRDIVEAIDGPLGQALPLNPGDREETVGRAGAVPTAGPPSFRPDFLWPQLAARFADLLEEVSVESLCRQAARAAVNRAGAETYIYQI
ncbi:MAG: Rrf2 family transcriptional regulator [Myxococcota bacterium]